MSFLESRTLMSLLSVFALLPACSSNPSSACTPGASVACVGAAGCAGGQVCRADGSGFEACLCGTTPDAGGGHDAGTIVDSGGETPDTSTTADVGADGGDPTAVCGSGLTITNPVCAACLSNACCTEATNCIAAEPHCLECSGMPDVPNCSPEWTAFDQCMTTHCATECN